MWPLRTTPILIVWMPMLDPRNSTWDGATYRRPHICGHHILKCIRSPSVREQLALNAEDDNTNDCRAVVVIKIDAVVGYLPRETAKTVRSTVGILFMGFRYHSKLRSRHQSTCTTCLRMCIDVAYARICKL